MKHKKLVALNVQDGPDAEYQEYLASGIKYDKKERREELEEVIINGYYSSLGDSDFKNIVEKILSRPLPENIYNQYKEELEQIIESWGDFCEQIQSFIEWNPQPVKW